MIRKLHVRKTSFVQLQSDEIHLLFQTVKHNMYNLQYEVYTTAEHVARRAAALVQAGCNTLSSSSLLRPTQTFSRAEFN